MNSYLLATFGIFALGAAIGINPTSPVSAQSATMPATAIPALIVPDKLPLPTILVNTLDDFPTGCPDTCSLRGALAAAKAGDVIGFSVSGTAVLTDTLVIDKNVTIIGIPGLKSIVDGGNKVTVIQVQKDVVSTLYNLVVEHGNGGIINDGTLTLVNVAVVHNVGNKNFVSGIENHNILRLFNSTVAFNKGAGVAGIYNHRELDIYNSTIALNVSLFNDYQSTGGILESNCCGDYVIEETIMSSIVAQNTAGLAYDDFRGTNGTFYLISQGHNIFGSSTNQLDFATSDQIDGDKFMTFVSNHEEDNTLYLALAADSPAIGKGKCDVAPIVKFDMLGQPRKTPCDVGAAESGTSGNIPATPPIVATSAP